MKIISQFIARIPEWAMNYVINGDDTGLTESEIIQVNSFLWGLAETAVSLKAHFNIECQDQEEHYFTWTPEFGLGCMVQDCTILFLQEENLS